MLEYFDDFPQVALALYSEQETFDKDTGKFTETYEAKDSIEVWAWQTTKSQEFIRDKILDEADYTVICWPADVPDKTDIAVLEEVWYKILFPDNLAFRDKFYVIGLKRTEKPNNV